MTRINLVPPSELMDQHLFAEFREIKMVPKALNRSLQASTKRLNLNINSVVIRDVLQRIPKYYTLNTGHVSFFYDKGVYLKERYEALKAELVRRSFNFNQDSPLDPDNMFAIPEFNNHYNPTPEALTIIRQRIAEKIVMKPSWYKYYGKALA